MSEYFIGIDSGTQSTKTILFDAASGAVIASASQAYELIEGLPAGHKEQHPHEWIDATRATIKAVLEQAGIERAAVKGLGVSGQQHGFVPLDADDQVIRPAKLWCDTATSAECEEIINGLGGLAKTIEVVGNGVPAGFTASKILWLKHHEPENYARLASVLLPHDYLNFWLTGRKTMECGDASGTALLDVRNRVWSDTAIAALDPAVRTMLPDLIAADEIAGTLMPELAAEFNLSESVIVSSGGGDNMMGAIGTGNVRAGVVTVSLGTSGTIYACSSQPVIDPQGEIAAFCDSTGQWLPLVCTMNVTVATEMVRERFNLSHAQLSEAVASTPAGNDGLLLIPFFEGERTPNAPDGTGVYFGLREQTYTISHFARAAMEGTTLGLNYGLNRLRSLGIRPTEIRATGGGAKSAVWRQILADVFNAEVVCTKSEEGAALGAAIQAVWAYRKQQGAPVGIANLCSQYVALDETTRAKPVAPNVDRYARMQALHDQIVRDLGGAFSQHRKLLVN
ncbi:MAG: xylulokinase [Acidobacteria bacterium]|nr:xylulokinase [Acidobacteriota bacterium]MBI3425246.1 xylulokinase [Acidobacteriota bacterium]